MTFCIFIPNYHWNHTKTEFDIIPVAIWYDSYTKLPLDYQIATAKTEYHTSVFAVYMGLPHIYYPIIQNKYDYLTLQTGCMLARFSVLMEQVH